MLYKALIRLVVPSACSIGEYAVDTRSLKLQRLQNRVFRATGNVDSCTPVRELNVAFKVPNVYDCTTKLCRTQAEVILNHVSPNLHDIG
jgi:hypothetical protein